MEILHKNPGTEVRARLTLSSESDYTLLLDGAEAVVVALEKDKPQYFAFDARQRQSLYRLRVIDIDIVILLIFIEIVEFVQFHVIFSDGIFFILRIHSDVILVHLNDFAFVETHNCAHSVQELYLVSH